MTATYDKEKKALSSIVVKTAALRMDDKEKVSRRLILFDCFYFELAVFAKKS